jgi:hypothetical protein
MTRSTTWGGQVAGGCQRVERQARFRTPSCRTPTTTIAMRRMKSSADPTSRAVGAEDWRA